MLKFLPKTFSGISLKFLSMYHACIMLLVYECSIRVFQQILTVLLECIDLVTYVTPHNPFEYFNIIILTVLSESIYLS